MSNRSKWTEDEANRNFQARMIWRHCVDAEGSAVDTYLRGRGITIEPPHNIKA